MTSSAYASISPDLITDVPLYLAQVIEDLRALRLTQKWVLVVCVPRGEHSGRSPVALKASPVAEAIKEVVYVSLLPVIHRNDCSTTPHE